MLTQYAFYFLSILAIFSALMVVFSRNPVHSVLYLVVTFFSIAGHYFLMNSQFLAMVHIIVYAGAIMVLFLYVIMMLNLNTDTEPNKSNWVKGAAVVTGGLLMLILVVSTKSADQLPIQKTMNPNIGLISNLGKVLYNEYMLPFEVSSILFLVSMVGAVMLGKKETY
jgi:NADH-quinone oxidoreductase subunit J